MSATNSYIIPELKKSYKKLLKNLVHANKKSRIHQLQEENKKKIAMLTYQRINLVRQNSVNSLDPKLKLKNVQLLSALNKKVDILKTLDPAKDKSLLFCPLSSKFKKLLVSSSSQNSPVNISHRIKHLNEIADFVKNQSEYDQLLERYNPGMTMSQEENVKRTAAKVGLQIPHTDKDI
ncbi:uncharacterized protein SCODWIG_02777 [Saccharomycodes ludwigii]|uniref:ATP synthase assembly factor FMC1, mitochondrial n=1 Tax=Saccharomycodes ludwigii TaxID=36035 RepID=A0A376B8L3_9ASCO|nr:hypothetical protein SCDLUD_002746 [Saccharomycodes ludwigii]KAH3901257.1 hypothetical protein SCDLUD_002746 [Saccharomycodes ludwigii]SSD61016.1 uncharacterized protein SCODWIG_02777 [Saccharomycodes ludwigii]